MTRTKHRDPNFSQERYCENGLRRNSLLTITEQGAGKLFSSHDDPCAGRGGPGCEDAEGNARRRSRFVPVELDDQIMLATSKGKSIRVSVEGIFLRSAERRGVKVLRHLARGESL